MKVNKDNRVDYSTKVLEVENLKKYFYHGVGKNKLTIPAVDGLTFDVYKREVFGLVGESGCGKTTTGRTIIKLYNATEGIVKLNQEVIGAGYLEHVAEIKRIKKEAKERILKLYPQKFKASQIQDKCNQDVSLIQSDIDTMKRRMEQEIIDTTKPLLDYKENKYTAKNVFDMDIEQINYDFHIQATNVHKLATNEAETEYEHEMNGAKIIFGRKVEGLKESAALEKETIARRITELQKAHEKALVDIEAKYAPLIVEQSQNIISKDEVKKQLNELKLVRKEKIAKRKEQYKLEKSQIVKPSKSTIKISVAKIRADYKLKIARIQQKIDALKVEAKEKIAKLPLTNNEDFDKETLDKKTWEVKEWLRDSVREQKETIHYLKSTNKSKEALMTSRKLQMIFQDPISSLNPRMTVQEIVGEGLTILGGYSKTEIKEKVGEVLELVGLSREYAARYPHEFSGGQRQRIGVARALIMNPDFIIADEPISALDVSIRAQVINLLTELKESLGLTILFIAHDLSVVRFFCDRIAVMYNGKIVELADSEELFANPTHPYTLSLLSSIPQPDPDYEKNRKRINYSPMMHDYRVDKASMHELAPDHYIYVNDKEFADLQQKYNEKNGVKANVKGEQL